MATHTLASVGRRIEMEDRNYLERAEKMSESADILELGTPTEREQQMGISVSDYIAIGRAYNEERARTGVDTLDFNEFKDAYIREHMQDATSDPTQQMFNRAVNRVIDDLTGKYHYEEPVKYYEGRASEEIDPFSFDRDDSDFSAFQRDVMEHGSDRDREWFVHTQIEMAEQRASASVHIARGRNPFHQYDEGRETLERHAQEQRRYNEELMEYEDTQRYIDSYTRDDEEDREWDYLERQYRKSLDSTDYGDLLDDERWA